MIRIAVHVLGALQTAAVAHMSINTSILQQMCAAHANSLITTINWPLNAKVCLSGIFLIIYKLSIGSYLITHLIKICIVCPNAPGACFNQTALLYCPDSSKPYLDTDSLTCVSTCKSNSVTVTLNAHTWANGGDLLIC